MIRIQQLKLPVTHTQEELEQKIRKTLKIGKHDLQEIELLRRSIDARKKSELKYVYQLDVKVKDENAVLRKAKNNQIVKAEKKPYVFPKSGEQTLVHRPVIIGSGPAGLFCAYVLAKHGYRPLVLERGESAEQRKKSVDAFWKTGVLNPESNVQFGEGGAGTFSDGKLNTSVKDPSGRNREVLRIFTECGAPEEILYDQKPHLGTDQLIGIVTTMRKKIEAWGGEVRFGAKVTDFGIENGRLTSVTVNETEKIAAETAVLAIGHSARDTFFKLCENKISMEAKSFAVGVRIEHPQKMITEDQYGPEAPDFLGAAPYKLTNQCENGRGVYSFCMCPGGYVVNASSEAERTCVNGMSYSDREGKNANSAMIVTVTPEDYRPYHVEGTPDVLDGVAFQRALEHAAWEAGKGKVPVQLFGDFCENRVSTALGEVTPSICGEWTFANLLEVLPTFIGDSLVEGIRASERKIHGFSRPDAVLSGVEARTSSPVRIVGDVRLQAVVHHVGFLHRTAAFHHGDRAAQVQPPGNAIGCRRLRQEGAAAVMAGAAQRAKHRAVVHRLRGRNRGIDIAHRRDGDHAAFDHGGRFHAEEGWRPDHEVSQLTHLNGSDFVCDAEGQRRVDGVFGDVYAFFRRCPTSAKTN